MKFWNWIYQLGGMEKELYEMPEFKSYILPIIRNDYRILENYAGKNVPVRDLAMDLYMMGGRQDDISQEEFSNKIDDEYKKAVGEGENVYGFRSNLLRYLPFCTIKLCMRNMIWKFQKHGMNSWEIVMC